MAQTKWRPFFDIKQIFEDSAEEPDNKAIWDLAIDLYEDANNIFAEMDMPGINPNTIEVSVVKNYLKITGATFEETFEGRTVRQRSALELSFKRMIRLPARVQNSSVKVLYRNGILKVAIPKEYSLN